jgi:hypothetical protein
MGKIWQVRWWDGKFAGSYCNVNKRLAASYRCVQPTQWKSSNKNMAALGDGREFYELTVDRLVRLWINIKQTSRKLISSNSSKLSPAPSIVVVYASIRMHHAYEIWYNAAMGQETQARTFDLFQLDISIDLSTTRGTRRQQASPGRWPWC